jgi:hypothetical protein
MTSASAIGEVVTALHAAIGQLDNAGHATNDAAGKAGEALTRATTLGAPTAEAGLAAVSGSIERLAQQVQAAIEIANDIVAQATAVADGT